MAAVDAVRVGGRGMGRRDSRGQGRGGGGAGSGSARPTTMDDPPPWTTRRGGGAACSAVPSPSPRTAPPVGGRGGVPGGWRCRAARLWWAARAAARDGRARLARRGENPDAAWGRRLQGRWLSAGRALVGVLGRVGLGKKN